MGSSSVVANVSYRCLHVWRRNADVMRETWLLNLIPPLLEPVFYVLAFGLGVGGMVGLFAYQGLSISYIEFMAPGILAMAIMYQAFFETTYSSFVRMYYQRTFDAIIATPLLVEDVIAGEWLWGATRAAIATALMLPVLAAFGLVAWPWGLLCLPLAAVGGLLFSALGLVTTALVPKIDAFNLPTFLFIVPMFMFGGTFFPLERLPGWARDLALCLPLTHVCLLARSACLARLHPLWAVSIAYLAIATLGSSWLALAMMKRRLIK